MTGVQTCALPIFLDGANPVEHPQDRLVGPPVEGPVQRTRRAGNGRVHVHAGGGQVPRGRRGAVHLVLRMQHKHDVQRLGQSGVGPVARAAVRGGVEHVQEALGVSQALLWGRRAAARLAVVRRRCQRRRLAQDPHDLLVAHGVPPRALVDAVPRDGGVGLDRKSVV